ncbi:hypothetical protein ONE63_002314 [Megalurothrips usitatus]|uniref:Peptidase S1 domain-containing protein n=1 Tax=Megalurothrips usitatus TaxID=439358 RepID=A0AAV7XEG0_9NEOP|nr:hypothetical protein ONE63_002314 [Megalurothrips usitatus]
MPRARELAGLALLLALHGAAGAKAANEAPPATAAATKATGQAATTAPATAATASATAATAATEDGRATAAVPTNRIINGDAVPAGKYPFFAIVRCSLSSRYTSDCGGALVTSRWVVTAAHCLLPASPPSGLSAYSPCDLIHVLPGVVAYDKRGRYPWLPTDRQIKHPTYNPRSYQGRWYDIALVRLVNAVPTNANVGVIPLPTERESLRDPADDGATLTIMGIGETMAPHPTPGVDELRAGHMTFMNMRRCKEINSQVVEGVNFCLSTQARGDRFCTGDSGGPIVGDPSNSGRVALVGVIIKGPAASSGSVCVVNQPYYAVRVFHFREWINNYIQDDDTSQQSCSCVCPTCDRSCLAFPGK